MKSEQRTGWACRVHDQDGQRILSTDFEDIADSPLISVGGVQADETS